MKTNKKTIIPLTREETIQLALKKERNSYYHNQKNI